MFRVIDLVHSMHNCLRYLPRQYAEELATDYRTQERLVVGICTFMV